MFIAANFANYIIKKNLVKAIRIGKLTGANWKNDANNSYRV